MPAPAPAIMQEVIWKNEEVLAFAVSLVRAALFKLKVGTTEFTTDIVPDAERGTGGGIAGSVVTMLQTAHVIQPVGVTQGKVWYPHRVKSERPGSRSRYLNVYRLASAELAEKFLERNFSTAGSAKENKS